MDRFGGKTAVKAKLSGGEEGYKTLGSKAGEL